MTTDLFFRNDETDRYGSPFGANLVGNNVGWRSLLLSTSRGAAATSQGTSTVAGPTAGIEVSGAGNHRDWLSPPLAAAVTISGSITWNLRAAENNMSANVAINGIIEKIDGATGAVTLIDKTARTTELGTGEAAALFAEAPAAGVACKKGDRLRVRIFGDDAGTMASGFSFEFWWDGPTAGASGDSWLRLQEDLSFVSTPAGTQIFPTDTASDVSTASVDREAWTSRGAGVQTDVTNTAAGPTSSIQVTDTAGGTVVDWFTKQLAAFTLSGAAIVNLRGLESNSAANAGLSLEIARVNSDGTSPTVWALVPLIGRGSTFASELNTTEEAFNGLASGDDLAVSDGQRLRFRVYIDDAGTSAMSAGHTVTIHYAGTSGGASGDMYVTFTQTLSEFVVADRYAGFNAPLVALDAVRRAASWCRRHLDLERRFPQAA